MLIRYVQGRKVRKKSILTSNFNSLPGLFEEEVNSLKSKYLSAENQTESQLFEYYETINNDNSHFLSKDDICTPLKCVKTMLDYIPEELWHRKRLKILDPCCGNGNFGAYCQFKTNNDNIWYNDINPVRIANCKKILNPKNITSVNALLLDSYAQWDLIMANPPYSGGSNKNTSISNLFIEKAIDLLKDGGYLCFITPNNWMSYNNNNTTLRKLLSSGSFVVIDNNAKKYFPQVGSSFTILVWQKAVYNHITKVINNYLLQDIQYVSIPKTLKFIPLYLSKEIVSVVQKLIQENNNKFTYRCDLHNYTQKDRLMDVCSADFPYETIHTARKTRYANIKQDIYDKWNIIVPLSTYFIPYIRTKVNVTQSVGYISCESKKEAEKYLKIITKPEYKLIVHLTRYGNFNNIMVLKHLAFDTQTAFTKKEMTAINTLIRRIKY